MSMHACILEKRCLHSSIMIWLRGGLVHTEVPGCVLRNSLIDVVCGETCSKHLTQAAVLDTVSHDVSRSLNDGLVIHWHPQTSEPLG
jgi:hypothetical protein